MDRSIAADTARTGPSHANPRNRHQTQRGAWNLESKFCIYQQQKRLVCTGAVLSSFDFGVSPKKERGDLGRK